MSSTFDEAAGDSDQPTTVPDNDMDYKIPERLYLTEAKKPWFGKTKDTEARTKAAYDKFVRKLYEQDHDENAFVDNDHEVWSGNKQPLQVKRDAVKKEALRAKLVDMLKQFVNQNQKKIDEIKTTHSKNPNDLKTLFEKAKKIVCDDLMATRNLGKITKQKLKFHYDEITKNMNMPSLEAVDHLLHIFKENKRRKKTFLRYFIAGRRTLKPKRIIVRASRRPRQSRSRGFGATQRSRR